MKIREIEVKPRKSQDTRNDNINTVSQHNHEVQKFHDRSTKTLQTFIYKVFSKNNNRVIMTQSEKTKM